MMNLRRGLPGVAFLLGVSAGPLRAQSATPDELAKKVQLLTEAVGKAQQQLQQSQQQISELRRQLDDVRQQIKGDAENPDPPDDAERLAVQVQALKENQNVMQAEIATHEQSKVETESKYPVKLSGLILLNGFVNTRRVDVPATPGVALPGSGSTGVTMRQTVLGLSARGPHVFGATTHADVWTDFFGGSGMTGGYGTAGLLRLRTAHADVDWSHAHIFFSLDRAMINPTQPSSLTSVAVPALAWSGNLWTWNPQLGAMYELGLSRDTRVRMEGSLIDVADPPYGAGSAGSPASSNELSRWPGVEARLALVRSEEKQSFELGAGGYFAKHRTSYGSQFDSWAATLDYRQPLPLHLQLSGNFYRGMALGGLGGGAYKDYGVRPDPDLPGHFYVRPFDDAGGWEQLKERLNERLEFNSAFGIDDIPGREIRRYAGVASGSYQNLARTQTIMGNVIYSPSVWLQFSMEYRHLASFSEGSPAASGHVLGIAAGYKF